jgi:hypothetical protein
MLLLFVAFGVFAPILISPPSTYARVAFFGLSALALGSTVALIPTWGLQEGEESAAVREQQVSIGHWIHDELPADARVALNDIGATTYYGGHNTVDLLGLTEPTLAKPFRNGPGSLYEQLQKLPPRQRPTYFILYSPPNPFAWAPDLVAAGILKGPIKTFDLATQSPNLVMGNQVGVYRADWSTIGTGRQAPPVLGQTLRDEVDVADLQSEHDHGYQARLSQVGLQASSVLRTQIDSNGKRITDWGTQNHWGRVV